MSADDRGWDLASGVGLTATEAAAARAAVGHRATALIEDPYAEKFVRAVGIDFFVGLASGATVEDGFAFPRMVDWVSVRTKYLDDYFAEGQAAGLRQAVILGSGLDARAFRLDWLPQTSVYEVDQPGVVEFKTAVVNSLGLLPRASRYPVGMDLCEDWEVQLLESGFDPDLPTAWSAEGLLPYLPGDVQTDLLDTVTVLSAPGSRFAADTIVDLRYLTSLIAQSMRESARPREVTVDIDSPTPTAAAAEHDAIEYLGHQHGWHTAATWASDLFEDYGLPGLLPAELPIFQRIRLVKAALMT